MCNLQWKSINFSIFRTTSCFESPNLIHYLLLHSSDFLIQFKNFHIKSPIQLLIAENSGLLKFCYATILYCYNRYLTIFCSKYCISLFNFCYNIML
jgi:hypothetical protein